MKLRDYYVGMKVRCLYTTETAGVWWGYYKDHQENIDALSFYPTQICRGMTGIVIAVSKGYGNEENVIVLLDNMPTVIAIWKESQLFEEAIDACED